ncbi:purine-cytosine permease family protein [Streptomyces sp. NBC_01465]|uniref:purine-cytosine permease family protein n=1 Tax=Streptomyces sp. NBC_01465 TaxID=2903878 RepID=UPI002E2EF7F7|nr:cytosine permease [Streptomyces sp. NBC_01465]
MRAEPPRPQPPSAVHALRIEQAGAEPVPASERHGRPWSLFTLWFGANVQFATLSVGALSTAVFGLDLLPAALAITLGALLGSALIGLLSTRGPGTGVLQLIQSRGPFGRLGNLPSAAFTVVNGVGWCVVDTVLGVFILRRLFSLDFTPALLVMVVVQMAIAVVGHRMIHYVERVLAAVLVVVFAVVSVYGFGDAASSPAATPFAGAAGAFVLTVSVTSARCLGWASYASDYSRYFPEATSKKRVFGAAFGGAALAGVWIGVLGAALGTLSVVSDPSAMVSGVLPASLGNITLFCLLLSTLASTVIDLYSGSMAALVAGVRVERWVSVVCVGSLGAVLAWFAGRHDWAGQFQDFLLLTGYWLAPWAAVIIVAYWWRERSTPVARLYDPAHRYGWGLPAVLVGVLTSLPFMSQSLYTGPIAAAHPGLGDIGHFVGFAVAGLVFAALTAWKPAPVSAQATAPLINV